MLIYHRYFNPEKMLILRQIFTKSLLKFILHYSRVKSYGVFVSAPLLNGGLLEMSIFKLLFCIT